MSESIFEPFDPILFGWNTLKGNLQFFAILMIIVSALYYIPVIIQMFFSNTVSPPEAASLGAIGILLAIIYPIIYQLVELGLVGISLEFRDDKPHEIKDLFKNYRLFPNFLAATIIYSFMVAIGFILLIVPGIYLALKYMFYGYLIVDKGLGPIEALKESGRMTQGAKKNIIVYWLTLWCGMIVIMLILGLFVAAPAGFIAAAISKDLVPVFVAIANIITMIINLLIIVPITKLSMADVYRILETRLMAVASESIPDQAEA
jgi:uncharacterized membrane protein